MAFKIHVPLLTKRFVWRLLCYVSSDQSIAAGTYIQTDNSHQVRDAPTSHWGQRHAHFLNSMHTPQNLPSFNTCYYYIRVCHLHTHTHLHNHSNIQNASQIHSEKPISCNFPCSILPCLYFSLKACHFIKKLAPNWSNIWCTWKHTAFYSQEVDDLTNVPKNKTTQGWNKQQSTHSSLHQFDLSNLQETFLLRTTTFGKQGIVNTCCCLYNYSHTIGASGK